MLAVRKLFLAFLFASLFSSSGFAGGRSHSGSTGSSGTVHVSGYYRKDGTYVAPYTRRAPGTATGSSTTPDVSGNSEGTLAERYAAQDAGTTRSPPPKTEAKDEPLPKGFTTAVERRKELAKQEQFQQVQASRYEAHVVGLDKNGNPLISADIVRDSHGRIKRSESSKRAFMRMTGYANGRPGYVVDHIIPLAKGGADDPSNMQWQTTAEAKAKDKWERK